MKTPMSLDKRVSQADKKQQYLIKALAKTYDIKSTQDFMDKFDFMYRKKHKYDWASHQDVNEHFIDYVNKFERYTTRYTDVKI